MNPVCILFSISSGLRVVETVVYHEFPEVESVHFHFVSKVNCLATPMFQSRRHAPSGAEGVFLVILFRSLCGCRL